MQGKMIYFPFARVPIQSNCLHPVKKLPHTRAGITKDITDNGGNELMQARL